MLAYDWMLALVAFAVAAPLVVVLRAVQRHLVQAYDGVARAQRRDAGARSPRSSPAPRRSAPTTPARCSRRSRRRRSSSRADAQIRAADDRRLPVPLGRGVLGVDRVARSSSSASRAGPASGLTAGAMVGFMFLTYRFLEPIAEFTEVLDQTQTAVAGLRRVLGVLDLPGRPAADRVAACRCRPACSTSTSREVTFSYPTRGVTTALDEAVLRARRRVHPRRPAGGRRRGHRFGQDHARSPRSPASPIRPIGEIRLGGVPLHVRRQRRAAPAPRRGVAGAVPVRRHDRRQHRVRQARYVGRPTSRRSSTASSRRLGRLAARRA